LTFRRLALIHFESILREARILSPLKNFQEVTQAIEHRKDPLTHRGVIVIKGRMDYVKKFIESDPDFLGELVQSTQTDCPFCSDAILSKAPRFMPDIAPEGRIQVGEAKCFPSLFAHNDYNAIVVPSRSHALGLAQLTPRMLVDGFRACLEYFERVRAIVPEAKYPAIVLNFLPPAGSTITHTHMQALASDIPLQVTAELVESSRSYFEKHGYSYWIDLIETEKKLGVRYVGKIGTVHWLTPFAPLGLNEAQAVIPGKSSLDQITGDDIEGLVAGIVKVLRFYHDTGVRSFNGAIYSGPSQGGEGYFSVGFRMVSRYGYKARFVSDVWALQYLLGEHEIYESPEETCIRLRQYFQ
jgi:UDPglucose--hexose-1-phosphate uridylyltransferase